MPASPNNQLPVVDRIQGLLRSPGFDVPNIRVTLSYTDRNNEWHDLEMPFLDAMYLLNLLKIAQKDVGFSMPDDPRAKKP